MEYLPTPQYLSIVIEFTRPASSTILSQIMIPPESWPGLIGPILLPDVSSAPYKLTISSIIDLKLPLSGYLVCRTVSRQDDITLEYGLPSPHGFRCLIPGRTPFSLIDAINTGIDETVQYMLIRMMVGIAITSGNDGNLRTRHV